MTLHIGLITQWPEWPSSIYWPWHCSIHHTQYCKQSIASCLKHCLHVRPMNSCLSICRPRPRTCTKLHYFVVGTMVTITPDNIGPMHRCRLLYLLMGEFLPRDATQSAVLLRQVVCPSFRLSVTLRYREWLHRLEIFKIISRLVSMGCSLSADRITDLLQREPPKILTQCNPLPVVLSVADIRWQIAADWLDRKLSSASKVCPRLIALRCQCCAVDRQLPTLQSTAHQCWI